MIGPRCFYFLKYLEDHVKKGAYIFKKTFCRNRIEIIGRPAFTSHNHCRDADNNHFLSSKSICFSIYCESLWNV
jgi:hypothetical protein